METAAPTSRREVGTGPSELTVARLEAWMRAYYHAVDHDIGSSGVRDLDLDELAGWCGFDLRDVGSLVLHDSEPYGGASLRAALADRWTGGDADRVMVTHGSSEAIYLVMQLALSPGDDVVVVDPAYQQLYDIAASRGCRVLRWRLDPGRAFRPDLDRLRSLLQNTRNAMIVVNFPHNPTGVSITPEEQRELVELAARHEAWLVWDHAFGELTYAAPPLPLPLDYERSIVFGTFSKSYGLAGLRVGWCIAPPELLARMAELRDYIALYVSPVLEFFAERAVQNADRIVARQREHASANLALVREWAHAHPDVLFAEPDGGVTTLLGLGTGTDAVEVCRRLAEDHRVLLVPGGCFGPEFSDFVRLGFGGTHTELTTGLERLEEVLRRAPGRTGQQRW